MTEIKTWQQAVDYTFNTRHSWRHGNGSKTAAINCAHFTRLRGSSFPIGKINQPTISQVCIELEDEGMRDSTINRVVSAVSTVLNHCAFDGLIEAAPKFRRRKESEGRVFWYTKEEVSRLCDLSVNVFNRQDLSDIIRFAAYTGMRQGEILKIRAKDIDLVSNKIHVGGVPTQVTKAKNWRAIPIHQSIQELINTRCSQATRGDARLFGSEWRDKDQLLRAFKKVNKLLNKEDAYVFHTLRHSYATWLADASVPIRTIMALCGHKRIETTLRYAKATDSALTDAMFSI
jgi:integrase|tara:strand:+ start:835 stop:1698 length:864 start_codon:yes stop_codon:yes gene_type:complete